MRFFTMDWWMGVQDGSDADPSSDYARHLASLMPLPPEVAALAKLPPLHDAQVRRLSDARSSGVEIDLDALLAGGTRSRVLLRYGRVDALLMAADPERGLPGPHGLGDLGYDEIDSHGGGVFEHRLLFSSGVELSLTFREFSFDVGAVQSGVEPHGPSARRLTP